MNEPKERQSANAETKTTGDVKPNERFVVSLDDLRAGRAVEAGRKEPLTHQSGKEYEAKQTNRKNENHN